MVVTGMILGLFFMIFWTPYLMAKGVCGLNGKLTMGEKFACLIPIVNVVKAEVAYFGKIWLCTIADICVFLFTGLRFLTLFTMRENTTICLISVVLFIASLLFFYISNCIFVYIVIHDADALGTFKLIVASILYPIGQFYIGHYLSIVIANKVREVDTFNANGAGY